MAEESGKLSVGSSGEEPDCEDCRSITLTLSFRASVKEEIIKEIIKEGKAIIATHFFAI